MDAASAASFGDRTGSANNARSGSSLSGFPGKPRQDNHVTRRRVPGVCLALTLLTSCASPAQEPAPQSVRLATGDPSGTHHPLGSALANLFNKYVAGVHAIAVRTAASVFNVNALQEGSADLAFARADVAYRAFTQGTRSHPQPYDRLRGVAFVYVSVLHLIVRGDGQIRQIADLRGARIGYGSPVTDNTPPTLYSDLLSAGGELEAGDLRPIRMNFDDVADALGRGKLDGGFILSGYPLAALDELGRRVRVQLLEIDAAAAVRIRGRFPFYKPAVIPAGTYPGQIAPVRTVGVDNLLVCREDLPEELVYRLTRVFFERLPQLAEMNSLALQVNPDLAPATPLPLHPGAARYYRERELLK
jgi:TRAP transporter TAXI family solute receptor